MFYYWWIYFMLFVHFSPCYTPSLTTITITLSFAWFITIKILINKETFLFPFTFLESVGQTSVLSYMQGHSIELTKSSTWIIMQVTSVFIWRKWIPQLIAWYLWWRASVDGDDHNYCAVDIKCTYRTHISHW